MTVALFTGCFLVGIGPGIVFFGAVIARKPLLVLLSLTSGFVWLVSLIFIAAIWRGLLPLGSSFVPYIPLLCSAVAIQEVVRYGCFKVYKKVEGALQEIARRRHYSGISSIDRMQMALAIGIGHGGVHSFIFFLSLLTPALGPATFYADTCPHMSLFLVTAVLSLAFLIIHTFGMFIGLEASTSKSLSHKLATPGIHLTAALLSLVSFAKNGCIVGVPLVCMCAAVTLGYSAKLVHDKVLNPRSSIGTERPGGIEDLSPR